MLFMLDMRTVKPGTLLRITSNRKLPLHRRRPAIVRFKKRSLCMFLGCKVVPHHVVGGNYSVVELELLVKDKHTKVILATRFANQEADDDDLPAEFRESCFFVSWLEVVTKENFPCGPKKLPPSE